MCEEQLLRICVVSGGDLGRDPEARLLVRSLADAGHEVTSVDGGSGPVDWPGRAIRATKQPEVGPALLRRIVGRFETQGSRESRYRRRLIEAVRETRPQIVYPARRRDLELAVAGAGDDAVVMRQPDWPTAGDRDMPSLAPVRPDLSRSEVGPWLGHHEPGWTSPPTPIPDRHAGTRVAMVYRSTPSTPGRYLSAAFERAGVEVLRMGPHLDWDRVPDGAAAVIVVESPLPAAMVSGSRKNIPVLFWVHHGEHHLAQNLRLTRRYGADAVLLAHSWHLAHRFPLPVHRFPFAVPTELLTEPIGFEGRSKAVAMVGRGLDDESARYRRRSGMARALRDALGDRAAMLEGVSPEELMACYGDAKVVINDGGDRHLPITMRVFEATGAGAALLTDPLPGMEVLFDPGNEYEVIAQDIVGQVRRLDREGAAVAAAGHRRAMNDHTYDHRVDEALAIARGTGVRDLQPPSFWDRVLDPEVTTLAEVGRPDVADIPDRAVIGSDRRPDAAVVTSGSDEELDAAVTAARRFVYCVGADETVCNRVQALLPDGRVSEIEGALVIEKEPGAGYRIDGGETA